MDEEIFEEIEIEKADYKERFVDFLKNYRDKDGRYKYREKTRELALENSISLVIDFDDLLEYDPELASQLIENPSEIIESASKAIFEVAKIECPDYAAKVNHFNARFRGLPSTQQIPLRKIRAEHISKLISIEGIVTRITPVKYLLKTAAFRNRVTGEIEYVPQIGDRFTPAPVLETPEGKPKKKDYELVIEESEFIEWQKIVIQEKPEELPPGQLPRSIEVILKEDLVDTVRPGDRAVVVGILKVQEEKALRRDRPPIFKTYIDANYIEVTGKDVFEVEITPEDEKKILELAQDPNIRERIIQSIAPSIYGYEKIKKAIACLLFGGVPKVLPDGVRIRGDIHILLVGDPGTAKSQLLRYVASIAPRSVYTTGKGSTAAGLTAAVVRDKSTGEFYLEAGALVIADGGVACIDEFDKMDPRDRVSIHEAMEQQTISLAKAGIVATLNARTSILAAANPAFGRYMPQRNITENIDLPVTILSRFDLIFIITDRPNEEHDVALARHVVGLHGGRRSEIYRNIIPPDLLKKYIAYARKYIKPRLTKEAEEKIVNFYIEMRKRSEDPNAPVAITPRQLEALIRLAEAHAKMALKNEVTAEDAEAAIDLMLYFLQNVGMDIETQTIDIDVVMTGKPMSQREKFVKLMDILRQMLEENKGKPIKVEALIRRAEKEGLDRVFIEKALHHLKNEGEIYEPIPGYINKT